MTNKGAEHAVGNGWYDEITARRTFAEVVSRYEQLAERIW
jgi:hypothetical protein